MNKRILFTLCLLPALAYADAQFPSCPGSQSLSQLILNHAACADGYEFSDFSAIGGPAGSNLSSTPDVQFSTKTTGEPVVEFSGFTVDGGTAGALGFEIISYMISSLSGSAIDSLDLEVGALHETGTGGGAWVWELLSDSNNRGNLMWALPGGASKITLSNPISALRVFDVVALYAPPHDRVTLDGFSDPISATPEPGTVLMLGTALLALSRIARRRVRNDSAGQS